MWFNPAPILSYGCIFNMVTGVRGGGKTFNTTDKLIKSFNKKGERWVYSRLSDVEMEKSKIRLFDDLITHGYWTDHELSVVGDKMFMDGLQMGDTIALSKAHQYKGSGFPNTYWIYLDEFLGEKGSYKIKDPVGKLLSLVESCGRMRNIRVIMTSNSLSLDNEFFTFFGCRPKRGSRFTINREKSAIVELWAGEEYIEAKKKTGVAMAIQDTAIAEYMYDNSFLLDNYNFIEEMTGQATYRCSFIYQGRKYGVYTQLQKGIYHINSKFNPTCKSVFTFTTEDHKPNYIMFDRAKTNPVIKQLIKAHDMGCLRFDNIITKNAMYQLFDYL